MGRAAALAAAAAGLVGLLIVERRRRRQTRARSASAAPAPAAAAPDPCFALSKVRLAAGDDELLSIYRLRYMVYVGELKRSNYSYIDNIKEILEDPLDHADGCENLFIAHPSQARVAPRRVASRRVAP